MSILVCLVVSYVLAVVAYYAAKRRLGLSWLENWVGALLLFMAGLMTTSWLHADMLSAIAGPQLPDISGVVPGAYLGIAILWYAGAVLFHKRKTSVGER